MCTAYGGKLPEHDLRQLFNSFEWSFVSCLESSCGMILVILSSLRRTMLDFLAVVSLHSPAASFRAVFTCS